MTKAQTADLQAKWKQQGDPPPLCEHPFQELGHLAQSADGYTAATYYCHTCGEALVYTCKVPAFPTSSPSPALALAIMPPPAWSPWKYLRHVLRMSERCEKVSVPGVHGRGRRAGSASRQPAQNLRFP
jgi:hypothetical protein